MPADGFQLTDKDSVVVSTQAIDNDGEVTTVEFIEKYEFDGVDIDYEYRSSMNDSGYSDDFPISNARRAELNASY